MSDTTGERTRDLAITRTVTFQIPDDPVFLALLKARAQAIDLDTGAGALVDYDPADALMVVFHHDGTAALFAMAQAAGCSPGGYYCNERFTGEHAEFDPPDDYLAKVDNARYPAGARFVVCGDGASLTGMKPESGGWTFGTVPLRRGDVIETTGYGPGWGGDPGYGIHFRGPFSHCEFRPQAGTIPFGFGPRCDFLWPVPTDTPLTDLDARVAATAPRSA